jgi:nicotinate-nucleotide pyrophosphorylase (carboxylating)
MTNNFNFSSWLSSALDEDIKDGDHSSLACINSKEKGCAKLLVKEKGIIAGVEIAEKIFKSFNSDFEVEVFIVDGTPVNPGDIILTVVGSSLKILSIERLVLNVMQRMSGIATYTNFLVQKISHTSTKLLDTRKTTPNFRYFEKLAVKIGGGVNHRFGLYDMIMLKDNHIDYAGGIKQAIEKTQNYLLANNKKLKIEIEVRDLSELNEVLSIGGIDRIMLDNFTIDDIKRALKLIDGKYETEASGGITEDTIVNYAECGVDYISVGALTHQVKSMDLSLKAY